VGPSGGCGGRARRGGAARVPGVDASPGACKLPGMAVTLYHYWRSSSSWRVRWALAHKQIPFETVHINLLAGEQQGDAYRATNPVGYVPALSIDGHLLAESVAICEYLDETRPGPSLRPADPYLRARMRQLVELVNADTQPLQNLLVLNRIGEGKKPWAQFFIERGLNALEAVLRSLRAEGVAGPFCLGSEVTMAELYLVPQLYNARRFDVDLAPYPLALAAEAAALATDAARASAPEAWQPPG
jgi:maleylacetoacetate isomerase